MQEYFDLTYDTLGNLKTREEGVFSSTRRFKNWDYHLVFNRLTRIIDPINKVTTLTYDANGNVITIKDPLLGLRTFTHNAQGLVLTARDENLETTTFTYDANGNIDTITDPELNVTQFVRDTAGRVTSLTEGFGAPEARTTAFTYDAMNRIETITDGETGVTTMIYDAAGNVDTVTNPTGQVTAFTYDEMNRVAGVDDPARGLTTTTYDPQGNVDTVTDAKGIVTQFEYDAANQRTRTIQALGTPEEATTTFTYDLAGNLETVTDAKGKTTTIVNDGLDRVSSRTNHLGEVVTFVYDNRDNLLSTTDPKTQMVSRVYDFLNRLTRITYTSIDTGAAEQVDLTYDAGSNLLTITDADSALGFTYDGLDRVETASTNAGTQPITTLTSLYNAVGDRTTLSDDAAGGGLTTYGYDLAGRLTSLITPANDNIAVGRDAAGRTTGITYPNTTNAAATFDAITGRLATLAHGPTAARFVDLTYGHDPIGNITAITDVLDAAQDRAFTYDPLERLTAAGTAALPETYDYDPAGNRTTSHLSVAHTVNDANRLTQDDTYDYTYDANGNLESKTDRATSDATTYDYDAMDRLVRITFPDLTTTAYRYGALGRRMEKDVAGTLTKYVYDGENIALEYDGTDTLLARYSHGDGADQPLAQERGGASYFYHSDHQGSVVALTDAAGTVVNDYAYDAYGRIVASFEGVANPYTYTAREFDAESGLYYYRTRYYDANTGRFISEDPIGFRSGDTNLYRYVSNNPVNWVDPSGLARVCRRNLEGVGFRLGPLHHSQILFDKPVTIGDETVTDFGFFDDDSLRPEKKMDRSEFVCEGPEFDDDETARAIEQVKQKWDIDWRLWDNNCQNFTGAVFDEVSPPKAPTSPFSFMGM